MLLSTLQCGRDLCDHTFHLDAPMAEVIRLGEKAGWRVEANGAALCPDHAPTPSTGVWRVGCYTCNFEEDYTSEEEARDEYQDHECEPDTYLRTPEWVEQRRLQRITWAQQREAEGYKALAEAKIADAVQAQLERDAARWRRLHDLLFFWRRH